MVEAFTLGLVISSFVAGVLTFLAPCTLPLVPGYLGFISGVSFEDLKDPTKAAKVRRKVFLNGVLYVIGFSTIFILLGSLVGLGGSYLVQYRSLMARIGGVFVIFFGVFMLQAALVYYKDKWPVLGKLQLPFLNKLQSEHRVSLGGALKPGNPLSSIIFGATFALGWTPCVGPALGSILLLAGADGTVQQGALLLFVFSMGLGVPFLVLAAGIGFFAERMQKINRILPFISAIGGVFLIFLGYLVLTNKLGLWIGWFFRAFSFINYEAILDYL